MTTIPGRAEAGAMAKAFAQLGDPRTFWIVALCFGLTLLALVLTWWLAAELLTGWRWFNWGWVNWIVDTFTTVAVFFLVLLLFPMVLVLITSMFLDPIVTAVERRHYPHLPKPRPQSAGELVLYILKFTLFLVGVNLLALPLYILLPGINFLIAWTVNGYIIGREYYEVVAMRRLAPKEMRAFRRGRGGRIFSGGFLLAVLMTVPFLNLIMPVVAAAYMTHVFHAMWSPATQQPEGAPAPRLAE